MEVSMFRSLIFAILFFAAAASPAWAAATTQPVAAPVAAQDGTDMDQMLGAMLMFGFRGIKFEAGNEIYPMLSEGKIGGIILFEKDISNGNIRNIESPEQLKTLTADLRKAAKGPIFIGIDQEGGQVRRLRPARGFMDLPSAQHMGQSSSESTFDMADRLGQELASLGIDVDLAPVVDVDSNPYNPVIGRLGRAFSSDPAQVAAHALSFGRGLARNGVIPVLKHFPGQGCAGKDTHLGAVDISQCWNANVDLLPYAEIFRAGWPGMVMTGHLRLAGLDAELPATLSAKIVTGLLRDGLGWQGVVISDDMQMKAIASEFELKNAIALTIDAGIDILLFGNNLEWDPALPQKVWTAMKSLLEDGIISEERIRQSWSRINGLKQAYAAGAKPLVEGKPAQ